MYSEVCGCIFPVNEKTNVSCTTLAIKIAQQGKAVYGDNINVWWYEVVISNYKRDGDHYRLRYYTGLCNNGVSSFSLTNIDNNYNGRFLIKPPLNSLYHERTLTHDEVIDVELYNSITIKF